MAERKKPINSKAKGSEYERKIAKLLGRWFKEEFHRVPQSGGLRWGEDNRVAGDITPEVDSLFPFTVECKKREGWDLEQVLKGTGDVEKWWVQSCNDAERVNLKPLLIFSKNFAPSYMMMSLDNFLDITKVKKSRIAFSYFIVCVLGKEPRVVCNMEDFVKHISKEDILEAYGLEK